MNLAGASFRIGVDIGGTFTDVSIVDSYGHVHLFSVFLFRL